MKAINSIVAVCLMSISGYAGSVPAWQDSSNDYKGKAGTPMNVHIGEPTVVAVAEKEEAWGRFQFPSVTQWADGRLCVTYNISADAAESYGSPSAVMVSSDVGTTWTPHSGAWGVSGLLLPNGDRIEVSTPKPYKVEGLRLPKPVGTVVDTYGNQQQTTYRLSELQPKLRTVRISRLSKGASKPIAQHASLYDPQALRYTLRGLFPIVWWGDMRLASDGSIIAGIYPGYRIRDDGTMDDKGGVFFYRSTDFGHDWKIQGRIPYQPDLKLDPKGDQRGGFTEPAFEILKDGSLLCVMRTTDGIGIGPMYASWSKDMGKTWSKPEVIASSGVLPKLLRLENGVLVLASGRPGVQLRFCTDGKGKKWSEPFELVPVTSSSVSADTCGYTSLLATGPDRFLIAYSHFKHQNDKGQLRKTIKIREVQIAPKR